MVRFIREWNPIKKIKSKEKTNIGWRSKSKVIFSKRKKVKRKGQSRKVKRYGNSGRKRKKTGGKAIFENGGQ